MLIRINGLKFQGILFVFKIYADPDLNKQRLGELIDLIGTIDFNQSGHKAKDLLPASTNISWKVCRCGRKKGWAVLYAGFYRELLVMMLEPYKGRVYDG